MLHHNHTTRRHIAIQHCPEHYWDGILIDAKTYVTDGFDQFVICGDRFGDDLRIYFNDRVLDGFDASTPDHEAAVQWAQRQFEVSA